MFFEDYEQIELDHDRIIDFFMSEFEKTGNFRIKSIGDSTYRVSVELETFGQMSYFKFTVHVKNNVVTQVENSI